MAHAHTAADKNQNFYKSFGIKNINDVTVTSNTLTNNFVGLVSSGLGPDVVHRLPVESYCTYKS